MFSFHTKIYVDVIAMLFLYFIISFAWHSPPPWCISIVYVVGNQYSYLLNSSKFKMILSRFKKDMSTCNISKLPCTKYIISFLRLDMQRNHVDIHEKLKSFGFKKSEIINICRHMTLTFQIQLTRIFTFTCNLLMSTCTCTYIHVTREINLMAYSLIIYLYRHVAYLIC